MSNRIRKFNGSDGRVAWVYTHIDAVMGDNGTTLRQILKALTVLDPNKVAEVITKLEQIAQQVDGKADMSYVDDASARIIQEVDLLLNDIDNRVKSLEDLTVPTDAEIENVINEIEV